MRDVGRTREEFVNHEPQALSSLVIFGKCSEMLGLWNNFGKSSESGRKTWENRQKCHHFNDMFI